MPKTIFGTTEKSNFVLNLTPAGLHRYCLRVLQLALVLLAGGMFLYEVTLSLNTALSDAMTAGGAKGALAAMMAGLRSYAAYFAIGGVAALIFAFVGGMKRQYAKKDYLLPFGLCGAIFLLALASYAVCFDYATGLLGTDGRNEGLLALLFYLCFFVVGTLLRERRRLVQLLDWLVGFGLAGGALALLQIIPLLNFPSSYRRLDVRLLSRVFLPSGLSGSPISFAMLLTLLGGISAITALFAESGKRRRFHTIATAVFLFFLVRAQCIAGALGIAMIAAGLILAVLLRKGATSPMSKLVLFGVTIVLSILLVFVSPTVNKTVYDLNGNKVSNGYNLYDGAVIWQDGFYRLGTSGQYSLALSKGQFDVEDPISMYQHLWKKAGKVITTYPLLGTGPDNYTYSQLSRSVIVAYNPNLSDRPYNDYLYYAATRGIPSLLCYLALLVLAAVRATRSARRSGQWIYLAILLGLGGYAVASVFGISVIMVAPCFWMLLGAACGPYSEDLSDKPEQPVPTSAAAKRKKSGKK